MGSSGSSQAQAAANAADAQRQANIAASTARINQIFSSPQRQQQYADLGRSMMGNYTQDANRQKAIADRGLTFSLARSGLTGGSAAADAGTTAADEYGRGLLQASQKAQGAVSSLEGQDAQTRAQLTQLAQSGMNATTGAQQAASVMAANVGNARANATAQGLGDIFGQTSQAIQNQSQAAAARKQTTMPIGVIYGQSPYGGMGSGPYWGL